jgi:Arc/MetJ-type ribon-helix-helix transcriptional regulator
MNSIDRGTLLRLAANSQWPSLSLYSPVDRLGIHTDADRILLRELAKQAIDRLVYDGLKHAAAAEMVAGVLEVAADDTVWGGGPSGLAIFVTHDGTEALWLETTMPALVVAGDRFYLRPIYPDYVSEKRAWALAIDANKTRLFHLDAGSIEEAELPKGTSASLTASLDTEEREESLQFHSVPGATAEGAQGVNTAMFHGHGGERDFDKVERGQFMLQLSRGVVERIGAGSAEPLVLLGVGNMVDEFRASSHYAHIAPEQVEGATDYLSPSDVLRKVLAALAPRMDAARAADIEELRALAGTGRTSTDASEIVAAAAAGRVKTLVIDDTSGPWGWFDRTSFEVTHLCTAEPRYLRDPSGIALERDMFDCGWDLIDLAAAETVRHNGTVRAFRGESAPVHGAAAVFRY